MRSRSLRHVFRCLRSTSRKSIANGRRHCGAASCSSSCFANFYLMMLRYTLGNLVFLSGLTSYITIIIIRFPVATGAILIPTREWIAWGCYISGRSGLSCFCILNSQFILSCQDAQLIRHVKHADLGHSHILARRDTYFRVTPRVPQRVRHAFERTKLEHALTLARRQLQRARKLFLHTHSHTLSLFLARAMNILDSDNPRSWVSHAAS
jgi:hypothetical protein